MLACCYCSNDAGKDRDDTTTYLPLFWGQALLLLSDEVRQFHVIPRTQIRERDGPGTL